jgi:putative ABC transport system permease protein
MGILDVDHAREIWDALRGNKVRTLLTAFGVFWGIFLLMVMMGSGNGLETGAMQEFAGSAHNSVFMWGQRTTKPYKGFPVGRGIELTNEDVDAVRRQIHEAEIVCPHNQLNGYNGGNPVTRGKKSGGFSVLGEIPDIAQEQSIPIIAGRFLNENDLTERRKVAVIGLRVQDLLFDKGENPIGQSIKVKGVYFMVVGLFKTERTGGDADREMQTVYIPFTTYQQAFHAVGHVDWIGIKARDDASATDAEEKAKALLRERHDVAPDDTRAFGSWNMEKEFKQFSGVFSGIRFLVWTVGLGTLAAGVIGVSNIMLVIVKERTHEIGIRRAMGATPLSITGQIVLEALLLTSSAGYVGLILGMLAIDGVALLTRGSDAEFFKNPGVDIPTALKALVVLIFCGVLAGLMPAWRASRVSTVEALRAL